MYRRKPPRVHTLQSPISGAALYNDICQCQLSILHGEYFTGFFLRDKKRSRLHLQGQRYIEPSLVQCCSTVYDSGPTLNQQWLNAPVLLRRHVRVSDGAEAGVTCHRVCPWRSPRERGSGWNWYVLNQAPSCPCPPDAARGQPCWTGRHATPPISRSSVGPTMNSVELMYRFGLRF